MLKRIVCSVIVALALKSAAFAQVAPTPAPAYFPVDAANHVLTQNVNVKVFAGTVTLALPKNWPAAALDTVNLPEKITANYGPAGSTPQGWLEKMGVTAFAGVNSDPATYLTGIAQQLQANCNGANYVIEDSLPAGMLPAAMGYVTCPERPGTGWGEFHYYRVVQGKTALYLLSYSSRGPAFAANIVPVPPQILEQVKDMIRAAVIK